MSQMKNQKKELFEGIKDGIPIAAGYFAVSFSLGIAAKNAGLSALQGFLASAWNNASAGEYVGFVLIAADASYLELAVMTLITNARYFLMSCALSQKLRPETPLWQRLLLGYDVTDEIFGISIAREGFLNPYYSYGAFIPAIPGWAFGTMFGVIAGNVLPPRLVSALSVALYGMFIAIIIPPSKKSRIVAVLVALSFAASYLATSLPVISNASDGTRTIFLTLVISAAAAMIHPVKSEDPHDE